MAKSYRVECLKSEDAEGRRTWVLSARRWDLVPGATVRQMDAGAAEGVGAEEAIALLNWHERTGGVARIVEESPTT